MYLQPHHYDRALSAQRQGSCERFSDSIAPIPATLFDFALVQP
jgi:hypothetical protein